MGNQTRGVSLGKRSVQSGSRSTSQKLTFHLLLSQAAAVFSKALLGQNCHGAHCRLPTHTQSGYATGRDASGNGITKGTQDAQSQPRKTKYILLSTLPNILLRSIHSAHWLPSFFVETHRNLGGIFPPYTVVTKTRAPP